MRVGIDFGTTRTVIAWVESGRYPVAMFDGADGSVPWVPTMAALTEEGWVYGEPARQELAKGAPGLRSLKRALAQSEPDRPLAGFGVTALDLATGFLRSVREALEGRLGRGRGEPFEAMLAVPANASSRQRFLTLEAARRAGFDVLGLINEPSAAAVEYAFRQSLSPRSPKRYVAVYDLGGGTFDASAVSLEDRSFEMLASDGIATLGGDDFDELLLAQWEDAVSQRVQPNMRIAALETCRRAKEALTAHSRRVLLDPPDLLELKDAVLDARAFYDASASMIARTVECLDRVFDALPSDLDRDDARQLGAVYLVGGSVAFPAVMRALKEHYGRKVAQAPEPYAATAVGLAVVADPDAAIHIREATTRFFGVWREADDGRDTIFDPLLQKDVLHGGAGPLVIERAYRPVHSVGHLRFVECSRLDEDGRPAGDLAPFGEIRFPYDPSLATETDLADVPVERRPELGAQHIVERYVYDTDGRIQVRIENRTEDYRREVVLG